MGRVLLYRWHIAVEKDSFLSYTEFSIMLFSKITKK